MPEAQSTGPLDEAAEKGGFSQTGPAPCLRCPAAVLGWASVHASGHAETAPTGR